jgi:SAM-dependent methyltransferase
MPREASVKTVDEIALEFSSKSTQSKIDWYSPSVTSYDNGRPDYPIEIISEVILKTAINSSSKILEIGSGLGTATKSFAELGCIIDCVEPNPNFVEIARRRFENHPNIKIHQSTFEEYNHESGVVDIVLAATSFHWVNKDIAWIKSAAMLKSSGCLVLLWNKELQPTNGASEQIREIHEHFAPGQFNFESESQQVESLEAIARWVNDSQYFSCLHFGVSVSSVRYSGQRYIDALRSYSSYLKLNEEVKNELLKALLTLIETDYVGEVDLKYVTGYHIGWKV